MRSGERVCCGDLLLPTATAGEKLVPSFSPQMARSIDKPRTHKGEMRMHHTQMFNYDRDGFRTWTPGTWPTLNRRRSTFDKYPAAHPMRLLSHASHRGRAASECHQWGRASLPVSVQRSGPMRSRSSTSSASLSARSCRIVCVRACVWRSQSMVRLIGVDRTNEHENERMRRPIAVGAISPMRARSQAGIIVGTCALDRAWRRASAEQC